MQNEKILVGYKAIIVEGVSPKTNKPYMILKFVNNEGKQIHSEFITDFYKQEYFRRELEKGGCN